MDVDDLPNVKVWQEEPKDDHTWAFYYFLKRNDRYRVKLRKTEETLTLIVTDFESHD